MRDASTVKTHKLYYDDAYVKEFVGRVRSAVLKRKDDPEKDSAAVLDVVLDQTAFFPEEGGQSADTGMLAGFPVRDVQIHDGEIHHYVDASCAKNQGRGDGAAKAAGADVPGRKSGETETPTYDGAAKAAGVDVPRIMDIFAEGARVRGVIDWKRRFSNMQQHSGEHIFSGLVHRHFGLDNVGFHLSDREVTLDFNGVLTMEQLLAIEREANEAVAEDVPSVITFPTKEEFDRSPCRSKLDLTDHIRVVIFPGYDMCACCAPHVRHAGEIGLIKVLSVISWRGGVRVSIVCGSRALALFDREHGIVTEAANFLTTSADNICPQLRKMKDEIRQLRAEMRDMSAGLLDAKIRALPIDAENVLLFTGEADKKAVRLAVTSLAKDHSGFCGIFAGNDTDGYSFVIGSRTRDSREAMKRMTDAFQARGGGKPDMVQGNVHAAEAEIRRLF